MTATDLQRLTTHRVFQADTGSIHVQRVTVRGDHPPHDHDFHEIVVVQSGRGGHRTFYGDRQLRSGDVLVLRPGYWHAYHGCRALVVWNCCLTMPLIHRKLDWATRDARLGPLFAAGPLESWQRGILECHLGRARLQCALATLKHLKRQQGEVTRLGWVLMLLDVLAEAVEPQAATQAATRTHPAVAKVMRMLAEDRSRAWTLDQLAGAVRLNRSYLVRLFRQHMGTSPIDMLHRLRGETAGALLVRTDLPISRIGEQVGWPDPNHFARRFRKQFGCSPTTFRQRQYEMRP